EQQRQVNRDGGRSVQGMKTDAAALRIVYGGREQVVQIDQHGGQHDQPRAHPAGTEDQAGDQPRNEEVEGEVDHVRWVRVVTWCGSGGGEYMGGSGRGGGGRRLGPGDTGSEVWPYGVEQQSFPTTSWRRWMKGSTPAG